MRLVSHWKRCRSVVVAMVFAAAGASCRQTEPPVSVPPKVEPPRAEPEKSVLESRFAGSWYTANPEHLALELQTYLDRAKRERLSNVHALILPHAGYRYSGPTAAYGAAQVAGRTFSRVIVIGPTHRERMPNAASVPAVTHYATPLAETALDREFIERLLEFDVFRTVPTVHQTEHSVQMEIPLLQQALGEFLLVPIVVGQLDAETTRHIAGILGGLIDKETLVVASCDFTHYGPNYRYIPFTDDVEENIRRLDMGAFEKIRAVDLDGFREYCDRTGATICGREAVGVLLAMLPEADEARLLQYDTSGNIMSDFANSVSYLSVAFTGQWTARDPVQAASNAFHLTGEDRKELLRLARETLNFYYQQGRAPEPHELQARMSPAMRTVCAAFVTLNKDGHLRGCIGELEPVQPLYASVMSNALRAALSDPRFQPVQKGELPELHLEISALTPPREVASYEDIVIGKHGVILSKNGHRAVFLPQVAPEQNWGLEETLNHLSRKARLPTDAWRDGARFRVFEAIVFGEDGA